MKKIFFVLFSPVLFHAGFASALTFNVIYDSSVTAATNAAQIESAFAVVTHAFQDICTNAATIRLTIYWGPTGPFADGIDLGRSQFLLAGSTYAQITGALRSHRASAADTNAVLSLPPVDPIGTNTNWLVPFAEARVLGIVPLNDTNEDGEIGFATNVSYTFDPNNRSVAGKFDFIGVAEHELSEVMGRANAGLDPSFGFLPYDLFRFSANGVRSFDPNAINAYFSIDDGATALKFFYTNQFMGDIQDWKSSATPDSFDAFVTTSHVNPISTVDLTAMDILGYNGPRLAPPRVFGTNLSNGNFQLRFVNSPGVSFSILAGTNLTQPLSNWFVLGTATESPAGQFTFTDATRTNQQRFYTVRSP